MESHEHEVAGVERPAGEAPAKKQHGLPCYGCAYRREVPGSAHTRCVFDWMKHDDAGARKILTEANAHGIKKGWFTFPFNYDPIWGPSECPQRAEQADAAKIAAPSPLADLLSLLGGRL